MLFLPGVLPAFGDNQRRPEMVPEFEPLTLFLQRMILRPVVILLARGHLLSNPKVS